jgi:hypothetical protein
MSRRVRNGLIGACATIAVCATVMAGATYAILYQEVKGNNLVITAGNVDISAKFSSVIATSPNLITSDLTSTSALDKSNKTTYELTSENNYTGSFVNGGTVALEDGTLSIKNMTPYDRIDFTITISNSSQINLNYRLEIDMPNAADNLMPYLDFRLKNTPASEGPYVYKYNNEVFLLNSEHYQSAWDYWSKDNKDDINITGSIELQNYDNITATELKDVITQIQFKVEAVQGNATCDDIEKAIYLNDENYGENNLTYQSNDNGLSVSAKNRTITTANIPYFVLTENETA